MQDRKVHWLVRLVAIVALLGGLSLLGGGIYLITLGGSWYYAIAGTGMSVAGIALWQGRIAGVQVYLLIFIFTLFWSFYEVGLAFWPSVPRLVAPIFLAALVLLVVPLLPRENRPASSNSYFASGLVFTAMFVGFLAAMFYPHDVIVNTAPLAKSDVAKTTTDAGHNWYAYG